MLTIITVCAFIVTAFFARTAAHDFDEENFWGAIAMMLASMGMLVVSFALFTKLF